MQSHPRRSAIAGRQPLDQHVINSQIGDLTTVRQDDRERRGLAGPYDHWILRLSQRFCRAIHCLSLVLRFIYIIAPGIILYIDSRLK